MLEILDRIRERVDDETRGLLVDFEWHSSREVVTSIEIGLELGFDHGRMLALVEADDVSGNAATVLIAGLADLLGDTEAGPFDVLLALVAALRSTVVTARRERVDGWLAHCHHDSRFRWCRRMARGVFRTLHRSFRRR